MFITTAEFNGLSYAAYGNGILHSEHKILAKTYLGVICAHMVNFCRPGHIYTYMTRDVKPEFQGRTFMVYTDF